MMRLLAAAICALAAASGALAQAPAKMRHLFPLVAVDEIYSPVIVAKQMGYFRDEGIDIAFVPAAGANVAIVQLAAGNAEVAYTTSTSVLVGTQPSIGMRLTLFYNLYYDGIWGIQVPAASPIKTLADLKGKKIGVIAMGSAGLMYGKAYLVRAGLDPNRDATFLPIGVGAQGATALRSNAVDAAVYFDVMVMKIGNAGVPLRNLPIEERISRVPDAAYAAPTEALEKNPALYARFGRAIAKGYEFTSANYEAGVRMVWKEYPASKPGNVPEDRAIKIAIEGAKIRLSKWASPRTGGKHGLFIESDYRDLVQFAKDFGMLPKDAGVDLKKLYTNALVDEINKFDRDAVKRQAAAFDASKLR